jgi:ubiquinone/menaquinone biosynthesis C-methylase UbiE
MKTIDKQYNEFNENYSNNIKQNYIADNDFYQMLDIDANCINVLDIGCGDGHDLMKILGINSNLQVSGVDPSEEFIEQAQNHISNGDFNIGYGEKLPYKDSSFDLVISKYAIQTSTKAKKCLLEAGRVLRSGGKLHILIKHPMQQFLEKKKFMNKKVNYFTQENTKSVIYDGLITLKEPTHKMEDYLNKDFFEQFELIDYRENFDFPASEQVEGDIYPTYFVLTAKKK